MAEPDAPVNQDDFSPSLGGERAAGPDAPPAQEGGTGNGPETTEGGSPLGDSFSELFGAGTQAELESLVETFGLFGQTLQSLVTETMQVIETRLPQTLAAFEGLIDAVSQAFDEVENPPTTQNASDTSVPEQEAASEVQDQDT